MCQDLLNRTLPGEDDDIRYTVPSGRNLDMQRGEDSNAQVLLGSCN